ncbi:MAG: hypothetical protein HY300_08700 [Verrucomicrobia bacterium]|nr:hypothetical protein [Verrucomicrobiota bacterium]
MKLLMVLGGLVGFAIGIGSGLAQQGAWPDVLWRASAAALAAGLLLRWWGRLWIKALAQAHQEKVLAAKKAKVEQQAATAAKPVK